MTAKWLIRSAVIFSVFQTIMKYGSVKGEGNKYAKELLVNSEVALKPTKHIRDIILDGDVNEHYFKLQAKVAPNRGHANRYFYRKYLNTSGVGSRLHTNQEAAIFSKLNEHMDNLGVKEVEKGRRSVTTRFKMDENKGHLKQMLTDEVNGCRSDTGIINLKRTPKEAELKTVYTQPETNISNSDVSKIKSKPQLNSFLFISNTNGVNKVQQGSISDNTDKMSNTTNVSNVLPENIFKSGTPSSNNNFLKKINDIFSIIRGNKNKQVVHHTDYINKPYKNLNDVDINHVCINDDFRSNEEHKKSVVKELQNKNDLTIRPITGSQKIDYTVPVEDKEEQKHEENRKARSCEDLKMEDLSEMFIPHAELSIYHPRSIGGQLVLSDTMF